jgi:ElaB/YqjD/DUF883 family membrane-anchored ribosome-binding protein
MGGEINTEMEHRTAEDTTEGGQKPIGRRTRGRRGRRRASVNQSRAYRVLAQGLARRTSMAQSSYGGSDQSLQQKASDQLSRAADRAEDMASRVAAQRREVGDRMQEVVGNFKTAVDKSLRDQPMATLAAAAVMGFVLGALWKS